MGSLFGGISVIGLLLNLVMMVAILSLNRAALTLPGIAGLITHSGRGGRRQRADL